MHGSTIAIERTAHAKINLALHVTGQRDDGYHLLDSLVTFTEFGDAIQISEPHHPHGPLEVTIDGPFCENLTSGPENLVSAASLLLRDAVKRQGLEPKPALVKLIKNLPVASGIGGGSADAAAVLLALQEFWGSDVDLLPLAKGLGADVPMCLHSKPLRATGIGDEIQLLPTDEKLHLILVNPGIGISTPDVFRKLKVRNNPPISERSLEGFPALPEIGDMRSDLQQPAAKLVPVITELLEAIDASGAQLARMSGSGATCFGIFNTIKKAQLAAREIKTANPDWWCVATSTVLT